nr:Smr/MutS family protein [Eubacterium sp.]
ESQLHMEQVINQLEESEREMSRLREELEIETNSAKQLRIRLSDKEKKLSDKRDELIEDARAEAKAILEEAKSFADSAIRDYNKWLKDPSKASSRIMEEKRTALREKRDSFYTSDKEDTSLPQTSDHKASDFKIGDKVRVLSANSEGYVASKPDSKEKVLVDMGIVSSRFHISDLLIIKEDKSKAKESTPKYKKATSSIGSSTKFFKPEINLIGKTVDEAIYALDKYLDSALLAHVDQVTIIHGKGTGALKRAVNEYLKKKSFVKGIRSGEFGEGDAGVTIIKL